MRNKILVILSFAMLLSGCLIMDKDPFDPDSTLTIANRSSSDILVQYDFLNYPDTSIILANPFLDKSQFELALVKAGSEVSNKNEFKKIIRSSDTKMMLFVFSKDTIENISWERIREENLVLKRYDLSLEDLENRGWLIEYSR